MNTYTRRDIIAKTALAATAAMVSSAPAFASSLQPKARSTLPPLRVLIGFSRGSASDDLLRTLKPGLTVAMGRPIQIDLMPGDLGAIAAKAALASPPDGNTILVATFGTHAINPNLRPDLGYNPINDFAPICLATRSPLILGTRMSLVADSVQALVELAARQTLTYGSSGVGSAPYLAGLLFQRMTGLKLVHRAFSDTRKPYDALQDGTLDLSFNNAASMLPLVREKHLCALAVTTSLRCTALPEVPTLEEGGLKGYALNNWLGFVAPIGTPAPLISALNRGICAALREQSTRSLLGENGIEVVADTPEHFGQYIRNELERWRWLRSEG